MFKLFDKNITSRKFVRDLFLLLTNRTYPYGTEDELISYLEHYELLPKGIDKDSNGNYFYKIGDSRSIFTCHLDTACKDSVVVNHVTDGNIIKTDGASILGADDKAGMTIMLYMIRNNIPGLYYFFIGEEVGCIGSSLAAKCESFKSNYDRVISFDRRGTNSVITYQSSSRCCSDEFAKKLASELNKSNLLYRLDETGIYTDSAEFTDIISECTNISVGYYAEHTFSENQDIDHLEKLANACLKVEWEKLPIKRDFTKRDYYSNRNTSWNTNGYSKSKGIRISSTFGNRDYGYHDNDDWCESEDWPRNKKTRRSNRNRKSKTSPKTYIDRGNELIDITENVSKVKCYEFIKDKFLSDRLTIDELEIVKTQYFNMSDKVDIDFYKSLQTYLDNKNY